MLGRAESQLLIEMISHPEHDDNNEEINRKDLDGYIHGIIHNLKLWTIRQSRLKLLHLFNSNESKSDMDLPVIKLDNNSGKIYRTWKIRDESPTSYPNSLMPNHLN